MKFKSKVDWYIHAAFIIMLVINAWLIAEIIISPNAGVIIGIAVVSICNIITVPWWLNMHYVLDESELLIHLGGFGKGKRIAYTNITNVKETREPFSSSALSLDRIEIKFKAGKTESYTDVIYISPKSKQEFLKLLEEKRK